MLFQIRKDFSHFRCSRIFWNFYTFIRALSGLPTEFICVLGIMEFIRALGNKTKRIGFLSMLPDLLLSSLDIAGDFAFTYSLIMSRKSTYGMISIAIDWFVGFIAAIHTIGTTPL